MVSIGTMIKQLDGLVDTNDLSGWEQDFVVSIGARTSWGAKTTSLTEKQVERINELWRKHFA